MIKGSCEPTVKAEVCSGNHKAVLASNYSTLQGFVDAIPHCGNEVYNLKLFGAFGVVAFKRQKKKRTNKQKTLTLQRQRHAACHCATLTGDQI